MCERLCGPGRRRDGLCDFLNWRGASRASQRQKSREKPHAPRACRVRSRQLPHSATPVIDITRDAFNWLPCLSTTRTTAPHRAAKRRWFCRRAGRACTAIARIGPRVSALKQLAIGWLWEMPTVFAKQGSDYDTSDPAGSCPGPGTGRMIHRAEKIRNPSLTFGGQRQRSLSSSRRLAVGRPRAHAVAGRR